LKPIAELGTFGRLPDLQELIYVDHLILRLFEVLQIQADDLPPLVGAASLAAQAVAVFIQRRGEVASEGVPGDPSNLERSTPRAG